jgi:class 3 adenylate cyclase
MKQTRFVSLQFSMAAAFATTVLLTSAFIGISTFFAARSFIRESIRLRLEDIATLAAMHINVADAAKIHTREDEKRPEYTQLKAYLERVRRINPEIRFAYLYRVDANGNVFCVVENEPMDSPDMSHAGDPYPDATPLARKIYRVGAKAESEGDFWTDQWGVYLSSYIPVVDASGKVECGLGIDMSAKAVQDFERRFLYSLLLLAVLTAVIVLLGSLWYSRRISRPLLSLADDLNRVQRLELDHNIEIKSSVREVVVMRDAIQKMKKSLRSFRKYVPADLVADLMTLGQEARLSVEKREITIFFSDIADFTTLTEKTSPDQLVDILAVYFDGMTRAIIESKGNVDKYIGDAIMAFWGAPRHLSDHAVLACLAAIKCRDHARRVSEEQRKLGKMPLDTRIGLNTGVAIIGNIGYDERLNYTAMGDMINLGSRLEALNKYYGTEILISENTWQLAKDAIETRFIDIVAVKGKSIPVRIYEVICLRGGLTEAQGILVADYQRAMELYLARKFQAAVQLLEKLAQTYQEDMAVCIMLERNRAFLSNPPPPDWQGEFVMKSK